MKHNDRPVLRVVTLALGIATLALGLILLTMPVVARSGQEWLLAALLLGGAVMSAGFAMTALRPDVRVYTSLLGALSLLAGLLILLSPLDTFITLTTLLGFYFMFESGLMAGLGLSLRPLWTAAGALFVFAAISFVMSALIWLRLAGAPRTVILGLLGISFIARGALYIILFARMKGRGPLPPELVGLDQGAIPGNV